MKKNYSKWALLALCFGFSAHAGMPMWTFEPLTPTTLEVPANGSATVQYRVTNQSSKSHTLTMQPIQGITQITTGLNVCGNPFVLPGKGSCILSLEVNGSQLDTPVINGPLVCQQGSLNQCYRPSVGQTMNITRTTTPGTTTLISSISSSSILALSINNTSQNAALTGNPRHITITNTGSIAATGLDISYPTWPTGTTASSDCGVSLAAGASCTITITPGSNATSNCTSGIAPTPGTITVNATNVATSTSVDVVVLGYGCQYQGGFVYSVNDMTPNTGSIGGKVASLVDQAEPEIDSGPQSTSIIWSSNGSGATSSDVSHVAILGIDENSTVSAPSPTAPAYPPGTPPYAPCDGALDGACNTNNIISYYNFNREAGGSPPTPVSDYAAGLCTASINGYADWYLPAICEILANSSYYSCPSGFQDMATNLSFLLGYATALEPSSSCTPPSGSTCLAGGYWSSTEYNLDSSTQSYYVYFDATFPLDPINASTDDKEREQGVRCSRALTY